MQLSYHSILKRFGLFLFLFYSLSLLCINGSIRNVHNIYYSSLGAGLVNMINPHVHVNYVPGAPENDKGWDMTFLIFDKRNIDKRKVKNNCRAQRQPNAMLFQNLHHIVLLPSLLLICLIVVSPFGAKEKFFTGIVSVLIFYFLTSFHLSFIFENHLNDSNLEIDSIWHGIISLFGFNGFTDGVYALVIFIWGLCIIYNVYRSNSI